MAKSATERSSLLAKPDDVNGAGSYVSITEVGSSSQSSENGDYGATATATKNTQSDEESQGRCEAETGISRSHVARIIAVLLIGPC